MTSGMKCQGSPCCRIGVFHCGVQRSGLAVMVSFSPWSQLHAKVGMCEFGGCQLFFFFWLFKSMRNVLNHPETILRGKTIFDN